MSRVLITTIESGSGKVLTAGDFLLIIERGNELPVFQDSSWNLRLPKVTLLLLVASICWSVLVVPAHARPEKDPVESKDKGPQPVFAAIEKAWVQGDEVALSNLVQIDGIRVTLDGGSKRSTEYSRSQSVYFFKNLFQTRKTQEFYFTRLQDAKAGERAHAMATWRYKTSGPSGELELRLVFLLTRQDDVWRLSEINKITVR